MLTFLAILSACLIFCKADLAEEFSYGYCPGRSGSIIIDNEKNSKVHFQSSFNVESATDTQLYNIIARALNLPRVDSPSTAPIPVVETHLFSKPTKNFFFSFDGLSLSETSDVSKMKVIGKNALEVTRTTRPYSPASLLATTLTGQYPRNHGIVKGREPMKGSHVSMMSVMGHVYPHAHVISGSYMHESALLLASKKEGAYYWDNVKHSFKQASEVEGIPSLLIGDVQVNEFVKAFNADSLFAKESWSLAILRSELAFVWHAAAYLKDLDGTQFLNFHFQSIDMVRQEFGIASKEVEEAVSLMDSVLATITSKASYEMLYLPSLTNQQTKSQVSLISGVFPGLNLKTFPQIYLDSASENGEKSKMCNRIRELLQSSTTNVFCMFTQSEANSRLKRSEDVNLATSDYTVATFFEPVQAFHLYFWFFLFLIVVLGYSVYLLVGIEVDQGTVATSAYVQKKSNM